MVGRQALEIEFLKGALRNAPLQKRDYIRHHRPNLDRRGMRSDGATALNLLRRTERQATTEIVAAMTTICDEFEVYGYRRVGAELRHRGMVVNSKKVRRLMRELDSQPKRRRRFVATTDSDHELPDLPGPRPRQGSSMARTQLWVADITYIAIATGFVYLAAILDAWSRRVIGYAISRSIDARVAVAALKSALRHGSRRKAAFTTPIAAHNTLPRSTATSSPTMVWSVPWPAWQSYDTPRLRAS